MEVRDKDYFYIILTHIVIGLAVFLFLPTSKIYNLLIIILGFLYIIKRRNANNEVLLVAGYIVGSEVFLRMTQGTITYEFSKYGVMICMLIGMYYSGFSKFATPFWIYLLFLLPGIVVATQGLTFHNDLRRSVAFNISGPFCLGLSALYCYYRRITFEELNNVLLFIGLPALSMTIYIYFFTPNIKDVITGTASNIEASGGFGPNQVATMLGLGAFVFFTRVLFLSKSNFQLITNILITSFITYRGLATFSRGGMITSLIMVLLLFLILFFRSSGRTKLKLNYFVLFFSFSLFLIWTYTSNETSGLINKRYANQDAAGRDKEDKFTGRGELFADEWKHFIENPVFGIGVGRSTAARTATGGEFVVSHSEISRTLSEHGTFGILALLIVFLTPLFLYLINKENIYIFCFVLFWILTINHAAMRIAAPAFVYSLSLLKVVTHEKIVIHRKQAV